MRHELWGILVAGVGILVAVELSARAVEASETAEAGRTAIVVRTYTQPAAEGDIGSARRTASAILGRADIEAEWLECALPAPSTGAVADACNRPPRWNELLVRIVSAGTSDGRLDVSTLGFAFVDLDAGGGSLATIYADRVRSKANEAGVDAAELLGRTIAHEVGHLLLGTNRHSRDGLMRASWSRADLRRNRTTQWLFGGRESEVMRRRIAVRFRDSAG
jgi:hypothetical protein